MNYSTLSLSALKVLALENNVIPTGDKRAKQSWIDALELVALQSTEPDDSEPDGSEPDSEDIFGGFCNTADVSVINYGDMPETTNQQKTSAPVSNKKGATTVFASLLCILIIAVQAVLYTACLVVQAAIHLKNLFGSYNPNYDLFGQLQDLARQRKLSVACE
jgi:hypothetical protein